MNVSDANRLKLGCERRLVARLSGSGCPISSTTLRKANDNRYQHYVPGGFSVVGAGHGFGSRPRGE